MTSPNKTRVSREILVDAAFPGGNIVFEGIEGDDVLLRPDLRDTEGSWFYWYFRVRGAGGRTLKFVFTSDNPVGVRGAAISKDHGWTWRWLGAEQATTSSFVYAFGREENDVRFSFGMPYTQANWDRFLAGLRPGAPVRQEVLCRSRRGRAVERLHVGKLSGAPPLRIQVTARNHACEMMADYAIEGLIAAALADDETGRWFQSSVEMAVIPFVDKDGVEDGDQGKNRRPHDHNRDYMDTGIHPETRAIREFAAKWSEDRLKLAIDLHCPWIRSGNNESVFQVGGSNPQQWVEQQRLAQILAACKTGPLPYAASNDMPFGVDWNVNAPNGMRRTCTAWGMTVPGIRLSTSFEIAYANAQGVDVTADNVRAFGRDLAKAIRLYLGR